MLATIIAFFTGFINSIEAPPENGESVSILCLVYLNLLWLIPYTIKHYRQKKYGEIRNSAILYLLVVLVFYFMIIFTPDFDEEKWRSEIETEGGYSPDASKGPFRAHKNGRMVPEIIRRKVLLGLKKEQVIKILGNNYFSLAHIADDNICYYYTNKKFFDGCDKLLIVFKDGICSAAEYNGCD